MQRKQTNDYAIIGERIRDLRNELGLKQDDVCSQLNITRQCLSHWENGHALPHNKATISKLASILHCDTAYLSIVDHTEPIQVVTDITDETGLSKKAAKILNMSHACESTNTQILNMSFINHMITQATNSSDFFDSINNYQECSRCMRAIKSYPFIKDIFNSTDGDEAYNKISDELAKVMPASEVSSIVYTLQYWDIANNINNIDKCIKVAEYIVSIEFSKLLRTWDKN